MPPPEDLSPQSISLARALMRQAWRPGRLQITIDISPYHGKAWQIEISRVERVQVLEAKKSRGRKRPFSDM